MKNNCLWKRSDKAKYCLRRASKLFAARPRSSLKEKVLLFVSCGADNISLFSPTLEDDPRESETDDAGYLSVTAVE